MIPPATSTTNMSEHYNKAHFPLNGVSRSLAISRLEYFILLAMPIKMIQSRTTIPEHVIGMKIMNRGVRQDELSKTIARAIWERVRTMPSWVLMALCKILLLLTCV
jgi:hypothetical protein